MAAAGGGGEEPVLETWPEGLDCAIPASRLSDFQNVKRGGFAMVYRARLDGAPVAVKVLHCEEASPTRLFVQEAAVLRMLRHRGIAEFHGVCTIPKGHPGIPEAEDKPRLAIVEEYLEGGRLKNLMIRGSTMGPSYFYRVLDVMIDIAEAVEYLHSFRPKVLHRDLTPDNILITRKDNRLEAKLVDFGLVALIGENNKQQPKLGVDSMLDSPTGGRHPPLSPTSQDTSRWGISSVDSWRVCADSRERDRPVEQLVPNLSRNRYGGAESGLGGALEGSHSQALPWVVDGTKDTQGKWLTEAKVKVKNLLGPGHHRPETGRPNAEQPMLRASREGLTPRPNGSGPSRRDELCPVALTGQTGSFMYMAPEIFQRQPYCETVDAFSFGTILFEVFSCSLLLVSHTDIGSPRATISYAHRVALGYRPTMPKRFPIELSRIILACWMADGLERPQFSEIVGALKDIRSKGVIGTLARRRLSFLQRLCGAGARRIDHDSPMGRYSF